MGNAPGERLEEQAAVWARIVELAGELQVDAILFAGDAFEGPIPTPEHYRAFTAPLARCEIPVVAITGNGRHDAAMRTSTALDVAQAPCLFVHARPGLQRVGLDTVAVLPWAPVSRVVAGAGGGDRDEINRRVADGIVSIARGLYVEACENPGGRILLAHWSVGGATTPTGAPVDLFREPVLDAAALEAIGFDAIVLGHIHKPQLLSTGDAPMFYVGSPAPLNFGESSSDHCVWLLDVEPGAMQVFQIPIESRRLLTMVADVKPDGGFPWVWPDDVDAIRDSIVKVKLTATPDAARRLDVAQLRRALEECGAHKVHSINVTVDRPEVARGAVMDEPVDDVEAMARWLALNGAGAGLADLGVQAEVLDLHRDYLAKAAA